MDIFGIGSAVKAAAEIYFNCARRSGRTTALIKALKPGDRVYFSNYEMSQWFKRHLKAEGVEGVEGVECVVWNDHAVKLKCAKGRAIFDHTLIEDLYRKAIEEQANFIKQREDHFSGVDRVFGIDQHPERFSHEFHRWQLFK